MLFRSLLFYWKSLSRQIRIEGAVHRVSAERSDAYFATRPRDSQVGAWASKQSAPMDDRGQLADRIVHYKNEFDGMPIIPRPEWWGGYCGKPSARTRSLYKRRCGLAKSVALSVIENRTAP